ncbi:MAG: SH3 domain-containing protein [Rhodocyclales bacterium]|nr:SH3 domain-containing protein [Rhodocyclales bacterium]
MSAARRAVRALAAVLCGLTFGSGPPLRGLTFAVRTSAFTESRGTTSLIAVLCGLTFGSGPPLRGLTFAVRTSAFTESRGTTSLIAVLCGLTFLAAPAWALEFRSVAEAGAVMFDAPSQKAKPLFVIVRGTPVEVVVSLEGWVKVRDATGDLAWIERKSLAEKRMLIVTAKNAEVRSQPDSGAPLVFEADKDVLLEFVETGPLGWARVRHRDGQSGYVRSNQVWGL